MTGKLLNNSSDVALLNYELSKIRDLDVLMEKILKAARDYTSCDAGSIYIKKVDHLEFIYAQNDTLDNVEPERKQILKSFRIPLDRTTISGYVALTGISQNITDVYNMPANLPYSFDKTYDKKTYYRTHSLLTVPLKTGEGDIIGILQLINALDSNGNIVPFAKELEPYVEFFASNAANAMEKTILTRNMILRMVKMTELRDPRETGNHVKRVAGYSVVIYEALARRIGISDEDMFHTKDILHMASMLHDVGKTAIPDTILKKPGRLTPEEYNIIKTHSLIGAQILAEPLSEYEKAAQVIALNHHERFDGTGYPGHIDPMTGMPAKTDKHGNILPKRGSDIPLMGRIVSIADVYDALSFARVYKEAWEQEKVLSTLWEERGKQFDPEIVDVFFENLIQIRAIAEKYEI